MDTRKALPEDVVEQWPEILDGITYTVVPLKYIDSVIIERNNGEIWQLKVSQISKKTNWMEFEKALQDLIFSYKGSINNIEFKLDITKIKDDVTKSTTKFLKKIK